MMSTMRMLLMVPLLFAALAAAAQDEKPYDQKIDVPYAEGKGETLYLDIFTPNGKARRPEFSPNDNGFGKAIIDVVSGGWNSSRGRLEEHEDAKMYHIFCARGYTVFAVRPGSEPDYTALEMVANIQRGIRWVKEHAAEYKIDPARIGIVGASAGGHLASLTALDAQPAQPEADDPLLRHDTTVKAVGVFFPPTDFLDWAGGLAPVERVPTLAFSDGFENKSEEELRAGMARISPARQVKPGAPPFFLLHGDMDPVVPLQQSEVFLKALQDAGVEAQLYVKKGGGHLWITIPLDIIRLADWFDTTL